MQSMSQFSEAHNTVSKLDLCELQNIILNTAYDKQENSLKGKAHPLVE